MKLTALLSFYDEQPEDLLRLVKSLPLAGVTHLAALDGAYALFPDAKPQSSELERGALKLACKEAGITLTLSTPKVPWKGNEVEKRTALFDLGYKTGADWYLVIDADEHITQGFDPSLLEHTPFDVAEVSYLDIKPDGHRRLERHPRLFRAIEGLHCFGAHFVYRTPDKRLLWGNANIQRLEPRHVAHELQIVHNPRTPERRAKAKAYYKIRDEQGEETGRCQACDERLATTRIVTNIRTDTDTTNFIGESMDLCDQCVPMFRSLNAGIARAFSLDLSELEQRIAVGA